MNTFVSQTADIGADMVCSYLFNFANFSRFITCNRTFVDYYARCAIYMGLQSFKVIHPSLCDLLNPTHDGGRYE